MLEIKAPNNLVFEKPTIFLAGSIEMGKAENWQAKFVETLKDTDYTILNPRRDDWDDTWVQDINNDQFRKQVVWELYAQEQADLIVMYFSPETKAPITLLELGLFARRNNIIVCCPKGYWRKGNVDVVCEFYNVNQVDTLDELIQKTRQIIEG